ncbi:hypothetical protein BMS3Bbin13_00011 [bacterium BMS3Bbin13]|nr:hypothetical protein BMS3Bbin13_00011 [bacterium BMS3Bbin13]
MNAVVDDAVLDELGDDGVSSAPNKLVMGYGLIESRVRDEVASWLVVVDRLVQEVEGRMPVVRHLVDGHKALLRRRVDRLRVIRERLCRVGDRRVRLVTEIDRLRSERDRVRRNRRRQDLSVEIETRLGSLVVCERSRAELLMEGWVEASEAMLAAQLLRERVLRLVEDSSRPQVSGEGV